MLREGHLDISVISTIEYARHPDRYLILPDLAIASDGPVESVLFLSRVRPTELTGKVVLLNNDALTSIFLVKILLKRRFGVSPRYLHAEAPPIDSLPGHVAGILMIGDPALRGRGQLPYALDLGLAWKELTGLPFVFAVWAVRREFYREHRDETGRLHRALIGSKRYSISRLDEICETVHHRVGLDREACSTYLKERLSFDLTPRHLEGMRRFFDMLEAEGDLSPAPQMEFIDA
jgi:chorismate dehydratase